MRGFIIVAMLGALLSGERPNEKWVQLGRGVVNGELVNFAVDDDWPKGGVDMIASHWRIRFVAEMDDGVQEVRFYDIVDCERAVRTAKRVEKYDKDGKFLRARDFSEAERRWESIAGRSVEAQADGYACLKGPSE